MPLDLPALLPPVRRAAEEAAKAILLHYEAGCDTTRKADGSPVTAADHAAEAVILPVLRCLTPDIPVVSEEEAAAGLTPDVTGGTFWLVDPLDGTKEFIRRNGEFTVNIALVRDGTPVLGVVLLPVTGECFAAAGPGTALRGLPGQADEPIRVRPVPPEGLTVLTSRSHADNRELDGYLANLRVAERVVAGSSLKFCRIAEGRGDLYPRLGPTCEWDTAAGHAVLLGAGGAVDTMDGQPLPYGKPGFLNPHFVARGG
ncbi:3'(2'),5'-bisphosphate nucleotidase CysQ [Aerophototrophica crusticola]|uniref:3'(2'),5'-bisphosphate nucleotidase CysQ n=1 Tax=Aerophototrophica crusticola TaxID=1709002 RepID=A0A858R550_9PROT|nr:3'(2'),5'-bisphosphate nucleotidase CysQ [Rhodospirillaceae bacterium B3]